MKKLVLSLALTTALTAFTGTVFAHTISLGYIPGASLGEVTFWVGNYTHGSPGNVPNEGSLRLSGQNTTVYGPTTTLFDLNQNVNTLGKPVGLNDGSNNFYASNSSGLTATNTLGLPVTSWQGVTISGLTAGDYMFEFIEQANPTQDWSEWNNTLNNIFTLKAGDIGGDPSAVPLPAALPLYGAGLALIGFMGWRKRRQSNKT
jgi:fibronectin-binding autotransporter adhesin